MTRNKLLLAALCFALVSCKKEPVNTAPKADFEYTDAIDRFILKSKAVDADGDILRYQWVSLTDSIKVVGSQTSAPYIELPYLEEARPFSFKLIVKDGKSADSITKTITLPKNTYYRSYGLGKELKKERSNNRDYSWYATQSNTGPYSNDNCGPTLATIAVKWVKPDFNETPQFARSLYKPTGGWWNTSDIISYLNRNGVHNKTINLPDVNAIQTQLDEGHVVILCLDHYYIRKEANVNWRTDKYYNSSGIGSGHFVLIKGYKVVDDQIYYEAYDPGGAGAKYGNGVFKGQDRYYRSEDLSAATINWWKYAIIVSTTKTNSSAAVDVQKIMHRSGG